MIVISEDAPECKVCEHYRRCDSKRKVACALKEIPEPLASSCANSSIAPTMENILVEHDYRDIKVAENTTITIDLEDIKKQIERDFYKSLNCGFLNLR
jgi:hypothetical protein